jgi:hypothetical protein
MKKIGVIEVGFGPHAKRVYGPALEAWSSDYNAELSLVVDLEEKEADIRSFFSKSKLKPDFYFIKPFEGKIPQSVEIYLDKYVSERNIKAVIISTEPLSHYIYAKWALKNGLNILMDKPITSGINIVSDMNLAKKIETDYLDLLADYNSLQHKKETIFSINVQRRFHPGFEVVKKLLIEVAEKTNCPITSIQSTHCDGQWRLPNEIVTQKYHPYCFGYGKGSHSGYHMFDAVYQFYKVSKLTGKTADSMEIFSSFFQPRGFLYQLNQGDYEKFFGKKYLEVRKLDDKHLYKKFKDYGEMDLSSIIRLKKGKDCIGNITISLMHNGFGLRTWILPGTDLYKGNGRVKHEYHNIEQGPFQNIQIHSYQSKDKHDVNTAEDFLLGGNSHFDIYVFRNKDITGDKDSLKVIRMTDLKEYAPEISDQKLAIEIIKHRVIKEFLGFLYGTVNKSQLSSNIDDHLMPVQIMSGVYQSHIKYMNGDNPLVEYELSL